MKERNKIQRRLGGVLYTISLLVVVLAILTSVIDMERKPNIHQDQQKEMFRTRTSLVDARTISLYGPPAQPQSSPTPTTLPMSRAQLAADVPPMPTTPPGRSGNEAATPLEASSPPRASSVGTDPLGIVARFENHGATPAEASKFLCIAWAESRFESDVVNKSSGSGGLFQFMPMTWKGIGMSGDPSVASIDTQISAAWALFLRDGFSPWSSDPCVG